MKIAFQGELGANGNIAALEFVPGAEVVPCKSFDDVFQAVVDGKAERGIIPVENSIMGRIADIHHLLPDSSLYIVGEHFLPIHHQLMGVKGATLGDVKTVTSQGPALSQCRNTIRSLNLATRDAYDTAGAAKLVAETGDKTVAALAPRLAAEIYGLDILKENAEDVHDNMTRFLVMGPEPITVPEDVPAMTTFIFRVKNIPAALYKALGGFASNGINMTKLESYQVDGSFLSTQFYVDVEGRADDAPLKRAFEELQFFTTYFKVLGTYPRGADANRR